MMKEIIAIEFAKLRKFTPLKVILLIYMALVPVFMYVASSFLKAFLFPVLFNPMTGLKPPSIWEFPEIWKFTFYASSWFHIVVGIIVVMVLSYEFSFKTSKQNIIDGLSKKKVILGKLSLVVFLAAFVTIYSFLVALVFGLINSKEIDLYTNSHYIFVFFFQAICYYSLALFFVVLIRHTVMAILAFALFPVIDVITGAIIPKAIYAFTPLNVFSSLTPSPIRGVLTSFEERQNKIEILNLDLWGLLGVSVLFVLVFYFVSMLNIKRRDI
ncbi:MAG: hypothetical protein ACK5B9_14985 [Flavobacteriia bacterium]|jgi:ABC-2 type transport system permease protein